MYNPYDEKGASDMWEIWDGEKFVPSAALIGEEAYKARNALLFASHWGANFLSVSETLSWSFDGNPHYRSGAVPTPAYTHTIRVRGASYYAMLDGEKLVGLVLCINNINNDRVLLFRPEANPGLAEVWAATRYMEFGVRREMDGPTTLERIESLQGNREYYVRATPFYEKEISDADRAAENIRLWEGAFADAHRKRIELRRVNASTLLDDAQRRIVEIDAELAAMNA